MAIGYVMTQSRDGSQMQGLGRIRIRKEPEEWAKSNKKDKYCICVCIGVQKLPEQFWIRKT